VPPLPPESLVVDRYPLGPVQTNCYVVRAERGAREAVVVDPGASGAQLRLELASMGASCAGILVTHCHWDHLGGVAELAEGTGAKVWFPEAEADVMRRPDDFYPGIGVRPYQPDVLVSGSEEIELAGIAFETIAVPGHSPGHVAYYADGCLFSGDVLFAGSVGRVDLPGGDWETLLGSIRTLLERYPPDTAVYSGHGPPTTLGDERATNPFLAELRA
jgi:glyoxylase-like metal-dependent hydrolase (beta-lactamase superfamily II)